MVNNKLNTYKMHFFSVAFINQTHNIYKKK